MQVTFFSPMTHFQKTKRFTITMFNFGIALRAVSKHKTNKITNGKLTQNSMTI